MYNTKDEIKEWLDKNYIERYIINDDLTVDVTGDVNLISLLINSYIPVKFGIINGIFNCECNSLTSLVNCPDVVTGYFSCAVNNLISLKGCPKIVKNDFVCYGNNLSSLDHLSVVYEKLYCDDELNDTIDYKRWKMMYELRK